VSKTNQAARIDGESTPEKRGPKRAQLTTARRTPPTAAAVARAMVRVQAVVGRHFPEALDAVRAALAVVAVGCLRGNTYPTTLIFVGKSGAGKTLALGFLLPTPGDTALESLIERSDEFTPAAFVSHASDRTKKELSKIDLLPRIRNKTLVTKELAPMFRGKQDDLVPRFNKLTGILDGMGYVSDSGTQGRRGTAEPINFQWLGATTPLSSAVLAVMETLGPRIVFYGTERAEKDEDELVQLVMMDDDTHAAALEECRVVVRNLVVTLHHAHPRATVPGDAITLGPDEARTLARWAKALVALRSTIANITNPEDVAPAAEASEHPERLLRLLRRIAVGHALINGRTAVNADDLAQIAHIALSSGDAARGNTLRVLLRLGGSATTPQIQRALGVSAPTAREYMGKLDRCGIAKVTYVNSQACRIDLAEAFQGLTNAPLLKDFGGKALPPESQAASAGVDE
jgi:hypothetical protein